MTIDPNQNTSDQIDWEIRVPILKNGLILKQLGLAIGIPFGIIMLFLLISKAYYGVLVVGITVVLGIFLALLIFRGTYDVAYILDQKSVTCRNQEKQKQRVKKLSAVTFWLGLFARNPSAAGAGALSGARTEAKIPWNRIRKVKFKDKSRTITIFAEFGETIALFCTADNYDYVKQQIQSKTAK